MDNLFLYLIIIAAVVAGIFYMKPDLFEKAKDWLQGMMKKKEESGPEKPLLA